MTRSPESPTQTTSQTESQASNQEASPLFDALMLEYIQNSGVSDLETVKSDTGAAVAVLLEGIGNDAARNKYKDALNAIPPAATENEIPDHLEMAHHAARQLDPTFPRVATVYQSGTKTFWNAGADEGTTGLAIVSDSRGIRLGENEKNGFIDELLPGHKIVVADNRLLDQLELNNALTLKGVVNDEGSRELYPLYGAVLVSGNNLGSHNEQVDTEASQQVNAPKEDMSATEQRRDEKRIRDERRAKEFSDRLASLDDNDVVSPVDVMEAFANDEELQAQIDAAQRYAATDEQRGFTVVNKRARSREELLFTPLDELNASIRRAAPKPPLPDHAPTNHLRVVDAPKPPLPDHAPTNHLRVVDAPNDSPESISWKEKLRHPFAYLAAELAAERTIRQNRREARGLSRERFDSDKKEKGLKIVLGAVGIALVAVTAYKLGWESHAAAIDPSNIPFGGGNELDRGGEDAAVAATEHARQVAVQHAEILNSPVNIIPNGGGGEAYTLANGADASLWYQNQNEFLQQFPSDAYRMSDGNVGFSHPGELSDSAKEYWAKKFGKWL